jgi:hypothetical protein
VPIDLVQHESILEMYVKRVQASDARLLMVPAKHRYEGSVRRMPPQLLVDDMYGSPSNKGNRADWQNSWLTRTEDVYKASASFGCRGTRGARSSFASGPSVKRHVHIALKQWFFRQSAYCCAQLIHGTLGSDKRIQGARRVDARVAVFASKTPDPRTHRRIQGARRTDGLRCT